MQKRYISSINLLRKEAVPVAKVKSNNESKPMRPALTPESRENQMISLAVDLAEKQLREGTASSQVITHYLKLGTTVAKLEKEKLAKENHLLDVKADAIRSQQRQEELFEKAIAAMKQYQGSGDPNEY